MFNRFTPSRKPPRLFPGTLLIRLPCLSGSPLPRSRLVRWRICGRPYRLSSGSLKFDAVKQTAVQIIAHEGTIQKIPRKTRLDFADLVQLRELLRVQRPFDAVQIVLQLRQFSRADDRNRVAPRAQPVE